MLCSITPFKGNKIPKMFAKNIATLIKGTDLANKIKLQVRNELINIRKAKPEFEPQFVAIAIGNNPASSIYLQRKQEAASFCGLKSKVSHFEETITQKSLIDVINRTNQDPSVHGIIVQLPLPNHLCETTICNAVHPDKDVDGFTQTNLGKLMQKMSERNMIPCTALAVKKILESEGIETYGRTAVVIGRSHNVGLPIAIILGADKEKGGFDMTTISCHRATPSETLASVCRSADVIVSAAGVPDLVDKSMVKPGACLIDVGLNRVKSETGKDIVRGDFNKNVSQVDCKLTPVPGGVGPCTVAFLMYNTLLAAKLQAGIMNHVE